MDRDRYDALITRLEDTAREAPSRYLWAVIGVTLLGFAILGLAIGFTALALLAIGGLVLAVIATGGKALIFFVKLGKLVILLALPAWAMVRAAFTLLFARFPRPTGRPLTRSEAPALFEHLDAIRALAGGPRIHTVLITDELNAAIVQHPRFGLFGWEHNYLILGLPLLQALEEPEALAVVAHEYGHLAGCHGRLGGFIYRLRSAWGRLQELSGQWNDWGSRLIARMFRWYAPYFNAYTFVLARQNEYAADRFSVDVVGKGAAAGALIRVDVADRLEHEHFWPEINRHVALEPEPIADRSRRWAWLAAKDTSQFGGAAFLEQALRRETDHHDTHPSLRDRLAAMEPDGAVPTSPPPALGVSAATRWFGGGLPLIEADVDRIWRDTVAERWQSRHSHLAQCRDRLAQISQKAELSADEQWERIKLLRETDATADVLPDVEALLAEHPGHVSGLYLRGRLRLESGDPAGEADLEAVMAADPDATLDSCELLWRYYRETNPERAEHYHARWQERSVFEARRRDELDNLPADAELAPADLPAATLAEIAELVARDGRYVRRAFLVRRVLKSDPTIRDYILAFETKRLTLGDKSAAMVKALSRGPYPVRLFIIPLAGQNYRRIRKTIRKMGIAPIFPTS